MYGKNYIIEPKEETTKSKTGGTPNPGYTDGKSGNSATGTEKTTTVTNNYYNSTNSPNGQFYSPASWSIVRYMYYPSYVVYVSPWRWGYYPGYWNPWAPLYWHSYYYGYHHNHYHNQYSYYRRTDSYRNPTAHNYYGQRRTTATSVNQRRESGDYRKTYSRPDLATKQMNDGRSGNDKNSHSTINKEAQQNNVRENKAPRINSNKETRTENKRPSTSVKQQRPERPNASPSPRAAPRSGPTRSANKGSGGR